MSGCDFCYICNKKYCPKEGKGVPLSKESITLPASTAKKLTSFCKKHKIMQGEKYYKVPDYASGILFLLDRFNKRT